MTPPFLNISHKNKGYLIFVISWVITFIVYLPAMQSGAIGDFPYVVESIRKNSLWGFVNAPAGLHSLFHFANLTVYLFYELCGTNAVLWHLVIISLHAFNISLFYRLFSRLFAVSGVKNGAYIVAAGTLLFLISPHHSETIVWISAYHHILSSILIFSVLVLLQQYYETQDIKYAWGSGIIYFASTLSAEVFYLTPLLILLLMCYYRFVLKDNGIIFRKAFLHFFVPSVALLLVHFIVLKIAYKAADSQLGDMVFGHFFFFLSKPLKYLFHIVFLGRYFPHELRKRVYELCESKKVIFAFYGILICLLSLVLYRFKAIGNKYKLLLFLVVPTFLILFLFSTLDFPDILLVFFDRYIYLVASFVYVAIALIISFIPGRYLRILLFSIYAIANLYCLVRVNNFWRQSTAIISHLLNDFPDAGNKTVLLLNLPDCLKGIPMISAQADGRFRTMKNVFTSSKINNVTYDVAAYNMSDAMDGAHVKVINDSTVDVTLNQWGTWWLYEMHGAGSYETTDYKVNMIDEGHWYEVTLKHAASGYMLLYQTGQQWKPVNWNRKGEDQF